MMEDQLLTCITMQSRQEKSTLCNQFWEKEFPISDLLSSYDPGVLAIDEWLLEEEDVVAVI